MLIFNLLFSLLLLSPAPAAAKILNLKTVNTFSNNCGSTNSLSSSLATRLKAYSDETEIILANMVDVLGNRRKTTRGEEQILTQMLGHDTSGNRVASFDVERANAYTDGFAPLSSDNANAALIRLRARAAGDASIRLQIGCGDLHDGAIIQLINPRTQALEYYNLYDRAFVGGAVTCESGVPGVSRPYGYTHLSVIIVCDDFWKANNGLLDGDLSLASNLKTKAIGQSNIEQWAQAPSVKLLHELMHWSNGNIIDVNWSGPRSAYGWVNCYGLGGIFPSNSIRPSINAETYSLIAVVPVADDDIEQTVGERGGSDGEGEDEVEGDG
ncbi:hypothetical protein F5884DRAFT_833132 [Xylogone sp. PMI_703]|nr:hypothetical protein F5884DRAFT_833132 [Xylogone sp. PMI_703]